MAIAYHAVLGAYGFWLPNDPRGSWSKFVASYDLFRFGPATKATTRHSVAHIPHDHRRRMAAKAALQHPPARFNRAQSQTIGAGFSQAIIVGGYACLACAIMPDHVHLVLQCHQRSARVIVGHMRAAATRQLRATGQWPQERPVWGELCWIVYLDSEDALWRAIEYTQLNPVREGKPSQSWEFVRPLTG